MSTPGQEQGTPAAEPAVSLDDSFFGSLSEAEQAHYDSSGESVDGLGLDGSTPEATPEARAPDAAQASPTPGQEGGEAKEGDDAADGEITIEIGSDGKARNTATGRFVPHAALHQQREQNKELKAKLEETTQRQTRAEARLEAINEMIFASQGGKPGEQPGQATEPEKIIDPDEDIFGAFKQLQERYAKLEQGLTETKQQTTARDEVTQLNDAYVRDATAFVAEKPDFKEAYQFIKEQMHSEFEMQGVTDKDQREALIREAETSLVKEAFAAKRSPSEVIYNLSKSRGFTGKAQTSGEPSGEDIAKATEANAERLRKANEGKQLSTTLSGVGSGGAGSELTIEQLADMSDAEWEQLQVRMPGLIDRVMRP